MKGKMSLSVWARHVKMRNNECKRSNRKTIGKNTQNKIKKTMDRWDDKKSRNARMDESER